MKTKQNVRLSRAALMLLMLAMLIGCFAITAFAAEDTLTVDISDLDFSNSNITFQGGIPTKVYDGSTAVTGIVVKSAEQGGIDGVTVQNAYLTGVNVGDDVMLCIQFALGEEADYSAVNTLQLPAKITPQELFWSGSATAEAVYQPEDALYKDLLVGNLPSLVDAAGNPVTDLRLLPSSTGSYVVSVQASAVGSYRQTFLPEIGADDPAMISNYKVSPISVAVTVKPLVIDSIEWADEYIFEYGADGINSISAVAYAGGYECPIEVAYPAGYGSVGDHIITLKSLDSNYAFAQVASRNVRVLPKIYYVGLDSLVVVGDGESGYRLSVKALEGSIPDAVLAQITYTYTKGDVVSAYASGYGSFTVVATLQPAGLPSNYAFKNAAGEPIETLSATLTVNQRFVHVGTEEAPSTIILVGESGISSNASAEVFIPTALDSKAFQGFRLHKEYTLNVRNVGGTYSILIPISSSLYGENYAPLSADNLYFYDATAAKLVKVSEVTTFRVSVSEGYYRIDGISGDFSNTLVIAPDYQTPFWLSAPGIALLVLLVLALLVLMFFIGVYLHRVQAEVTTVLVMDTEGEVPPVQPAEQRDMVDADEALQRNADELAAELENTVAAEDEEALDVTAETAQAVAESIDALTEQTLAEQAGEDDLEAADLLTQQMAEEAAAAEAETAVAEEVEVSEEELASAVAAAMKENFEDENAVQAFAEVDDDADDAEDEDEDSFVGFGAMPRDFIDAVENADAYALLLERERNGEIQIVTRYRKSFMSRLSQSQGGVQDYYSLLKNALLSYKGVKSRVSWNYESFNKGRAHLAKMIAKSKTLYVYLALDPEELRDTKYGIVDVSSKKKYASVPVLMKIRGDRKFKYCLELIDKLCGEGMELKKLECDAVDYRVPYQTTEEMVEAGLVKKMVAAVPVIQANEEPVEGALVGDDALSANEDADITFIAPSNHAAVDAAAEELAANIDAEELSADAKLPTEEQEL